MLHCSRYLLYFGLRKAESRLASVQWSSIHPCPRCWRLGGLPPLFFTFTVGAAAAEFELSCFSRRFLLFPTMPKLIFSLRPPAPPLPFGGGGPGAASSLASSGGVVVEEFCGGKSEIELCRCSFHLAFLSAAHDRIGGGPLFLFLPFFCRL